MAEPYPTDPSPGTAPPPVRINVHAPLWRILDALAAAGWGELRSAPQSVRSYLTAISRIADPRTGIAEVTDAQAAERAGVSVRTVSRARGWLQDRGVVVQIRRGARQGLHGVASVLSVTKQILVSLLPDARTAKDDRARRRAVRPGGAPSLLPNMPKRRPFPSLRRKTGAATAALPVIRPGVSVQDELRAFNAHAGAHPPRASTIAVVRAAITRRATTRLRFP